MDLLVAFPPEELGLVSPLKADPAPSGPCQSRGPSLLIRDRQGPAEESGCAAASRPGAGCLPNPTRRGALGGVAGRCGSHRRPPCDLGARVVGRDGSCRAPPHAPVGPRGPPSLSAVPSGRPRWRVRGWVRVRRLRTRPRRPRSWGEFKNPPFCATVSIPTLFVVAFFFKKNTQLYYFGSFCKLASPSRTRSAAAGRLRRGRGRG